MAVAAQEQGYAKGFETLEDEIVVDGLEVTGEVPGWLAGSLLRTGPAKFEAGHRQLRHWFDGLAMLHRFTFAGGAVSYGNRFLEGRTAKAVREEGRIAYSEFATDPCRSLFKRVQTLFAPEFGDSANVNVTKLGERFIAMTETPIPVQFDPRTLAAAGVPYKPPGELTTAHPHHEHGTDAMLNFAVKLGPLSEYRFFRVAPDGSEAEVIARIPVTRPGYVHSFGLTERWIVLVEYPWVVNPLALALSGRPYAENYRWQPERGTRIFLVDRATGEVRDPITTDPFFAFHHVNAYDDGDEVVVDLSAYEDPQIVRDLYLDRVRSEGRVSPQWLTRLRVGVAAGTCTQERLVAGFELGQIDYARRNGRPYRFAWGERSGDGWIDTIVRVDLREGTELTWSEPGMYPGEPVFVARPDGSDEDDGVLLSVVLDSARGTSLLLILDARDLTELARAAVPHHIPFSFHGRYAAGF